MKRINPKQIIAIVLLSCMGALLTYLFNFFVLERIIIPDPCYYHSHDTNKIFDLFYDLTAKEGFHPTPSNLNTILTLGIGATVGAILGVKGNNKNGTQQKI